MFQSHNGAIAAEWVLARSFKIVGFQSHNGAIAAAWQGFGRSVLSFNPTMVRLLPSQRTNQP